MAILAMLEHGLEARGTLCGGPMAAPEYVL
jgi:hypothetical protein